MLLDFIEIDKLERSELWNENNSIFQFPNWKNMDEFLMS